MVINATAVGVGRLYAGQAVGFRACYLVVLRRTLALLGAAMMGALIYAVASFSVAFVVEIPFALFAVAFGSSPGGAIALVVVGAAIGLAVLGALFALITAIMFAMYAIVIEGAGVFAALGSGFARVFSKRDLLRAIGLFACAITIYLVGFLMLLVLAGFAAAQPWLSGLLAAAAQALPMPLSIIILAVFYYDVRIRREGLDLVASVEGLLVTEGTPA
jgi:hypothetical protein